MSSVLLSRMLSPSEPLPGRQPCRSVFLRTNAWDAPGSADGPGLMGSRFFGGWGNHDNRHHAGVFHPQKQCKLRALTYRVNYYCANRPPDSARFFLKNPWAEQKRRKRKPNDRFGRFANPFLNNSRINPHASLDDKSVSRNWSLLLHQAKLQATKRRVLFTAGF